MIAIEDKSGLSATVDPDRRLYGEERMVIVGTDESVQEFLRRFDVSPAGGS